MKSKKAISITEVFGLLIAAIAILVIFIPIGGYVIDLLDTTPNRQVTGGAKAFVSELEEKHFETHEYDQDTQIKFTLHSQKEFSFRTLNPEDNPPPECFGNACFCVVDENFANKKCFPAHENIKFEIGRQLIPGTGELISITATARTDPADDKKTIIKLESKIIQKTI